MLPHITIVETDDPPCLDIAPAEGVARVAFAVRDYPDPPEAIVALIERFGPGFDQTAFEAIDHALEVAEQRMRAARRALREPKPKPETVAQAAARFAAEAVARVALDPDAPADDPVVIGDDSDDDDDTDLHAPGGESP